MGNRSLDFLDMIKNTPKEKADMHIPNVEKKNVSLKRTISRKPYAETIAVIDTETNWSDEVMSIGIALADAATYKCVEARYYVIDPAYRTGGMYSGVLDVVKSIPKNVATRADVMADIKGWLASKNTTRLFAYNAKFDYGHLKELCEYEWFDIMRVAAYKQYNSSIPENAPVCKTGRLKTGFSVERILRMLSGDNTYQEVHNAVLDAMDELKIMEFLGHNMELYECARIH